jgi:hypothetical protein
MSPADTATTHWWGWCLRGMSARHRTTRLLCSRAATTLPRSVMTSMTPITVRLVAIRVYVLKVNLPNAKMNVPGWNGSRFLFIYFYFVRHLTLERERERERERETGRMVGFKAVQYWKCCVRHVLLGGLSMVLLMNKGSDTYSLLIRREISILHSPFSCSECYRNYGTMLLLLLALPSVEDDPSAAASETDRAYANKMNL